MLIACPSCASRYRISGDKLRPEGRLVRCAACRTEWLALPVVEPPPLTEPAPAATPRIPESVEAPDEADIQAMLEAELAQAAASLPPAVEADAPAAASGTAPPSEGDAVEAAVARPGAIPGGAAEGEAGREEVEVLGIGPEGAQPVEMGPVLPPAPEQPLVAVAPARRGARIVGNRVARPRRAERPGALKRLGPYAAALVGVSALALVVQQRDLVARVAPGSVRLFALAGLKANPVGLSIEDLRSSVVRDGEARLLTVEGRVVNVASSARPLPRLELVVRDATRTTLYTWTAEPPQQRLAAGEAVPFRARLASPPETGAQVEVRFERAAAPAPIPTH